MMLGARVPMILLASALTLAFVAVLAGVGLQATGGDTGDVLRAVAFPLALAGGCGACLVLLVVGSVAGRLAGRRRRSVVRYQLVLSQADEAPFEEVAAACEQLVQAIRTSFTRRLASGQPWLALESWFIPASQPGETGSAALMLLCERESGRSALAALRHAYPDLTLRSGPDSADGDPLEFVRPTFVPDHVMRVRKARSWALPIGTRSPQGASGSRSTMAGIVRQQQQARRLSCVRWCIMPAADQLDSRATSKLERIGPSEYSAAASGDVQQALHSAGGAMGFLELQAAVAAFEPPDHDDQDDGSSRRRRRRRRRSGESFSDLQGVCRQLLSPALSQRGSNHLTERLMWVRQGLYRRRWARGEPPLLPDLRGATLVSPRELALVMELPSLGTEHALPLQRNTVPHLPLPTGVARARIVEPELPPLAVIEPPQPEAEEEILDAELVWEGRSEVPR